MLTGNGFGYVRVQSPVYNLIVDIP